MDPDSLKIILAAVPGIFALFIAAFSYLTARPKLKLEIEKLQKEIDKLSAESEDNAENISLIKQQLEAFPDEDLIYYNKTGSVGHDFRGSEGRIYDGDKPVTDFGKGTMTFLGDGIINIQRENTDGRYELYLRNYKVGTYTSEYIPKNLADDRAKYLRVSCEARAIDGDHTLRFVLRDREKKKWIGRSVTRRLSNSEWQKIDAYFRLPPLVEAELRVDDEQVSVAPSSIQIRNLVVAQRKSV